MNGKPCLRCKIEVSVNYNKYCSRCLRIIAGRSPEPKFKRDSSNTSMCSKCKQRPRTKGHNYCRECKNESTRAWYVSRGGKWKSMRAEQQRRAVVRRYIKTQLQRGRMTKGPCCICGATQKIQAHHLNYNRMTKDIVWICQPHHVQVEQLIKKGLTTEQALEYVRNISRSSPAGDLSIG